MLGEVDLNDERLEVRYGLRQYGGGRGVFAKTHIRTGTLVLSEEAVFVGPDEAQEDDINLHAATARAILQSQHRQTLLDQVALLCPVQLSDIPPDTLQLCRQAHVSTVEMLKSVEAVQPSEGRLDDEALLRLLLAMQMNAFYSGVYIRLALVNHGCRPNCHKFVPDGSKRSEIVATRDIEPGEEILINYVQPFGQSAARRQAAFQEQHLWPLPPSPFPPDLEALLDRPTSPSYERSVLTAGELEDCVDELQATWRAGGITPQSALRRAEKLLADCAPVFSPMHLVLARVRQLMIDIVERAASGGAAEPEDILLLVKCARELLPIQEVALGPEHCDVAATLDSLAQAMAYLMANNKFRLLQSAFPDWGTVPKVSKAQFEFSRRSKTIQALYR